MFTSSDMKEIYSAWMEDYTSWMNAKNIENYESWRSSTGKGLQQKAHQMRRTAFAAYLFQILGNKHIVLVSIQHPLYSAAQPAAIIDGFMTAWEQEKTSDD